MATVKTEDAERLRKRCQSGVGGRDALAAAHDIMAECYGTIGALLMDRDSLRANEGQLTVERERADYAWRNTRAIEAARQDEMRKRDAAEAAAAKLRGLLTACRGSVKTDLNAYERLLVAKQKHNEQQTPAYIAAESEAQRLFELLEQIDALALSPPNV